MGRTKPRFPLRPLFERLESRSLLSSSAQYSGVSNLDLSGPTAAIGPGGYRNIELKLSLPLDPSGQATSLNYLNIQATVPNYQNLGEPSSIQWSYGTQISRGDSNPQAAPNIAIDPEPISSGATTEVIDVYISPVVQYVDPNTGSTSNLTLQNGSTLSLTDKYTLSDRTATTDTPQVDQALVIPVSDPNLSQNLADPAPTLPALDFVTVSGTAEPQSPDGKGHITITNLPAGSVINTAAAVLTDVTGFYWNTGFANGDSHGRAELAMTISPSNNNTTADIAFPAERDEAGTTMTFRFQLVGSSQEYSSKEYVTDVAIPASIHTDPNLRDLGPIDPTISTLMVSPTTTPDMVTYTDVSNQVQTVDIQALLDAGYKNITLTGGSTGEIYTIDKSLTINSGMILQGSDTNVTLNFTMASVFQGAINFNASHITLNRFKIRFENTSVNFTGNAGQAPAIISDVEHGGQNSRVDLNIENLDIQAPFVPSGRNGAEKSSDPDPTGVSNADGSIITVETVEMGDYDSGTITGNTIYGGTIHVQFGPWTISDNHILGAVQGTLNLGVFTLSGGHDVTVFNNTAFDLNPIQNGVIDRFFVASNGGYNINLISNHIDADGASIASVGNIGEPAPTPNRHYSGNPRNDPEMILFEDYAKTFEGSVMAVGVSSSSSTGNDRRVIAIPTAELALFYEGSGGVLTVLDGPNADTSIPVHQVFNSGETPTPNTTYFLLASSLPQGTFDFDISPAYSKLGINDNVINTSGTISTGIVLGTTIINAQIIGNTFEGDQSSETDGNGNLLQSQAIRFELHGAFYGLAYPAADSYSVVSATIDHNTIINVVGGIQMYLDTGLPTTYGRTYGFVTLTNNTFQYSYPDPDIIGINGSSSFSRLTNNGSVVYDSSAAHFVDPRTLVITASGNYVQWTGVTPPTTDVDVNAAEINGALYEASAVVNPPLLPVAPPSNPTTPLNYQFVPFGTPASSGFTAVDPGTQEGTMRSYGFVAPFSNDQNGQVNSGGDVKTEVYGSDMTFQVDLPNGSYLVNASLVPDGMPSDAKYYLQGIQLGTLSGASNQGVAVGPFVAVVVDGRLRLRIAESLAAKQSSYNVAIETLSIRPLSFVFGDGSVAAPAGTAAVVNGQPTPPGTQFANLASDTNALPGSIYSNDLTFEVDLPNGAYDVTPTFGSGASNPMDFTRVYLQDTTNGQVDALSLASNGKASPTYLVDVVDGQLRLRLYAGTNGGNNPLPLAYIQALKIAPHKAALGFLFGQGGQQLAAGFDSVTNFTSYSSGLGYGFTPASSNVNAAAGQVFGSPLVFQVDLPNGAYLVTPTLGAQSGASSTTSVNFGSGADYLATGAGAQAKSYVVTVANGHMTLTLIAAGGDPVAHLMGLSIIPLNSLPIVDPGFESIAITDPSGYAVAPADPYWKYSSPTGSSTGVFSNTTTVFASPPAAPDGKQAAFLQDIGAFWQTIANWQTGYYTISFWAAQRAGQQTPEEILVKFDNTVIYDITPSGTGYAFYSTNPFWVAAGSHTITFVGVNSSGDSMVFIDAIQALVVPALQDPSFETPSASNSQGDYLINPLYSDWSFVGTSGNSTGVSGNGTAITTGDGSAPNGSQVAFIQDDGAITQSVPGWAAGTYSISFLAAQRYTQTATTLESFQVLVDGLLVGTFTPSGATYTNYATAPFTVTAGSHVVTFEGVDPAGGDRMALLDLVGIQLQVQTIPTVLDPGFESVVVNPGNFTAAPAGSPWTFTNATGSGTGVSGTNTAGVTSGEPTSGVNGDGTQVAFIQDQGSISQSVSGWAAGAYRISFRAAQRASSNQTAPEQFQVLVDGVVVGDTITPSQGAGYTYFVTAPFLVDDSNTTTPGKHTITFKGLNPTGDCMVLIDQVQITPE